MRRVRPSAVACALLALAGAAAAQPAAPDADADALSLESAPEPAEAQRRAAGTTVFVEAAAGRAYRRAGLDDRDWARLSLDARHTARWSESLQGSVSARLDVADPKEARFGEHAVLSLREAFVGWQNAEASRVVEVGRINLREGAAFGYNPIDFYRANTWRTITTANPQTLRENRLGTVMLRAQMLEGRDSLALVYAPKLASGPSGDGLSADIGATNARHRGSLTWGRRLSEGVNSQLILFKEAGAPLQLGAGGSALLSDAMVAHAEWSLGRGVSNRAAALGLPVAERTRQRFAGGLTYTTSYRLSLTGEYHYNGFALDRAGWRNLVATQPQALLPYYGYTLAQQDNASRHALFLYAVQRDLGWKNLDLTGLMRFNQSDRSRMAWLELRYRMPTIDLALQLQRSSGDAGSEFGVVPSRTTLGGLAAFYF